MKRKNRIFDGMYGLDSLSIFLLLIAIILNLITLLHPVGGFRYVGACSYLMIILCVIRGLSRNHEKRERENDIFLGLLDPIFQGMDDHEEERKQKKIFRFFKCPACKQKIRVPKGKGRVEITCPKCETKFIKKT